MAEMNPDSGTSEQLRFLFECLVGTKPTVERIEAMLEADVREDQNLDYKRGAWATEKPRRRPTLGDPTDFGPRLRKWIAGFANSNGGVLVIGVAEARRDPESGRLLEKAHFDPVSWTTDYASERLKELSALRTELLPPPISYIVDHPDGGLILVVAVPRSTGIVRCVEFQQAVVYFRFHDETVNAPAFLVEDLLLGRRRRPIIDVSLSGRLLLDRHPPTLAVSELHVWNEGLVWMEDVRAGIVFPSIDKPNKPLSGELMEHISFTPSWRAGHLDHRRLKVSRDERVIRMGPFEELKLPDPTTIPLPPTGVYSWRAALYVVCVDQPPAWFQLWMFVNDRGLTERGLTTHKLEHERPRVVVNNGSWNDAWEPARDWKWAGE